MGWGTPRGPCQPRPCWDSVIKPNSHQPRLLAAKHTVNISSNEGEQTRVPEQQPAARRGTLVDTGTSQGSGSGNPGVLQAPCSPRPHPAAHPPARAALGAGLGSQRRLGQPHAPAAAAGRARRRAGRSLLFRFGQRDSKEQNEGRAIHWGLHVTRRRNSSAGLKGARNPAMRRLSVTRLIKTSGLRAREARPSTCSCAGLCQQLPARLCTTQKPLPAPQGNPRLLLSSAYATPHSPVVLRGP